MKQLALMLGLLAALYALPGFADDPPPPAKDTAAASAAGQPATGQAAAAASSPAADPAKKSAKPAAPGAPVQVRVTTSLGSFVIELNAERAPLTVANFLKYVDQGQYTNTLFHRVIPNFVIQGGGLDTNYKTKPATMKVVNEAGNGLSNLRTTVGMARGPEPHSSDCQFYINLYDNPPLDPNATRWGYAVFGRVVEGMDVVDRIGNVVTGARGPLKEDAPMTQVLIQKVERVNGP